ncbi:unnamed protein product [Adineta steineri]|uniref:acylglycerol lipase n=1 Tax=Adineta steineri TaxID=433720 RepID=A0A813VDM5_9BILA|nr:unnamed protein product [Adineta steineri]CAF1123729.1 unnamed protein product [Adineta steineri]
MNDYYFKKYSIAWFTNLIKSNWSSRYPILISGGLLIILLTLSVIAIILISTRSITIHQHNNEAIHIVEPSFNITYIIVNDINSPTPIFNFNSKQISQNVILKGFLEYEYLNLEQYYDQLKFAKCPALILWGRQDQLCVVDAAYYFSELLSDSEVKILDECGHFISFEKAEETAKYIMEFLDLHSYDVVELPPTKF